MKLLSKNLKAIEANKTLKKKTSKGKSTNQQKDLCVMFFFYCFVTIYVLRQQKPFFFFGFVAIFVDITFL